MQEINNDYAIRVRDISKIFKLYPKPIDRLKEALHPGSKKYHSDFYALHDVNFTVQRGETVGILGKNGAGKSTLLKIITGVLTPSSGEVSANGKIASLLELGAGFNPEYTGIENVFFQGALMGFTNDQIKARLDKIILFADIGEFINQPVKIYSSGMFARLAFSVAINVEPDILIIDEALSVGDMAFQEKSITKMKEMITKDRAILFVSHSLPSVRNFCDRAIWIDSGRIKAEGEAQAICEQYDAYNRENKGLTHAINPIINRNSDSKTISITKVALDRAEYLTGDEIRLHVHLKFNKEITDFAFGVLIFDDNGHLVTLFSTVRDNIDVSNEVDGFCLMIPKNNFLLGHYFITISISDKLGMFSYDKADYCAELRVHTPKNSDGLPIGEGQFWSEHEWLKLEI